MAGCLLLHDNQLKYYKRVLNGRGDWAMKAAVALSCLFGAAALAIGAASPASAGVITETFMASFGPLSVPFNGESVSLSQFDPALGTLTGVQVDLSIDGTASVDATNNRKNSRTFVGGMALINVTANGPGPGKTTATALSLLASTTVPGDSSLTITGSTGTDSNSYSITGSLKPWIGTGTVSIKLRGGRDFSDVTCGTGLSCSRSATADGEVSVIYSYLSVPEPVGAAILAVGFIGLAAARRPRRS